MSQISFGGIPIGDISKVSSAAKEFGFSMERVAENIKKVQENIRLVTEVPEGEYVSATPIREVMRTLKDLPQFSRLVKWRAEDSEGKFPIRWVSFKAAVTLLSINPYLASYSLIVTAPRRLEGIYDPVFKFIDERRKPNRILIAEIIQGDTHRVHKINTVSTCTLTMVNGAVMCRLTANCIPF